MTTPSNDIPSLEFKFKTAEHVFYKNPRCKELDEGQCLLVYSMIAWNNFFVCFAYTLVIGDVQGMINGRKLKVLLMRVLHSFTVKSPVL